MRFGDKPSYRSVVKLFQSLEAAKKLDAFVAYLGADASEEFSRDLNRVHKIFDKAMKR